MSTVIQWIIIAAFSITVPLAIYKKITNGYVEYWLRIISILGAVIISSIVAVLLDISAKFDGGASKGSIAIFIITTTYTYYRYISKKAQSNQE